MTRFTSILTLATVSAITFLSSCGNSVTNVWDYYVKNDVEKHSEGAATSSKSRILYRSQESVNKSQLELIAFKQDSLKCLVIGSHKVAKAFVMQDSMYYFDVASLYSRVRGDDFIRQMGDLSIFFTHIPAETCNLFLDKWPDVKNKYMQAKTAEGETVYVDYALTPTVFLSFEKKAATDQPDECILWVGKRKHTIKTEELVKAITSLKAFN